MRDIRAREETSHFLRRIFVLLNIWGKLSPNTKFPVNGFTKMNGLPVNKRPCSCV